MGLDSRNGCPFFIIQIFTEEICNMEARKTSKGAYVFAIFIVFLLIVAILLLLGDKSSQNDTKSQNAASLQQCISTNVTPLQNLAAGDPNGLSAQAKVDAANSALETCKTQYPTQ